MAAIAIIAPDGNRVVAISTTEPLAKLLRMKPGDPRAARSVIIPDGDWPFRFDRVCVCRRSGWRAFRPDDLPAKYW